MLPIVPQAQRQRYKRVLDNILICNDYSFYQAGNRLNTRYGWYPVRRQNAIFNKHRNVDENEEPIGVVAGVDLTRSKH